MNNQLTDAQALLTLSLYIKLTNIIAMSTHIARVDGPTKDFSLYLQNITSLPVETVLEDIRLCKHDATYSITQLDQPHQKIYLKKLKDEGLYAIILGHLKRCKNESFEDVLRGCAEQEECIESPLVWVIFLVNTLKPEPQLRDICVEVADNIDPLYECMRDDVTRELFGSTEFWYEVYPVFLPLVVNLVMNNSKALGILLGKDGFLDMMIQPLFWSHTRPDIMEKEFAAKYFSPSLNLAPTRVLYYLVAKICKQIDDEGRETPPPEERLDEDEMKQLVEIGTKVIVSEAYDQTCDITFVAGLFDLIKIADPDSKQIYYYMLNEMATSGCVDNRTIIRAICHGSKATLDYIDGQMLPQVIFRLLHKIPPGDKHLRPLPDDARYAAAIDAGLLQMCMSMLLRFAAVYDNYVYGRFLTIIEGVSAVAFHSKTQQAIAKVDKAELRRILSLPELHRLGRSNDLCDKIFGTIGFFSNDTPVSTSLPQARPNFEDLGDVCSSCLKVIPKEAIKRCGQCKKRMYCNRECQANDWKNGHKKECKMLLKQGMDNPSNSVLAGKKNRVEIQKQIDNVMAAAEKMLNGTTPVILAHANVNGWDILDCVLAINFCVTPPSFDSMLAKDYSDNLLKEDAKAELIAYIEKTKKKGGIVVSIQFHPATAQPGDKEAPLMFVRADRFLRGGWPAAQKDMLEEMRGNDPNWLGPGHTYAGFFKPGHRLSDKCPPGMLN